MTPPDAAIAADPRPTPPILATVHPAAGPSAGGRRRLGFNVSVLAGSQAVTWSLSLLWTLVVPRLLGPAGMGRLTTAYAATAILGVVIGLGTRTFLVREIVARPADAAKLVGTALVLRVCLVPVFLATIIVYSHLAQFGSETTLVLYLATGTTVLTLLTEPMQATFQAVERMEYLAYTDVFDTTTQTLFGVMLAVLGFGAVGLSACALVIAGVAVVLNAWWIRPHLRIDFRTNLKRMRLLVTDSVAYWAFGLFFMVYLWIDSVMLSLLARPEVVGWYGMTTKLFTTLMFLPAILATAWLPRLVSTYEESPDGLPVMARAPIELVVLLGMPICVATAMTAGPVIHLLYGARYDHAISVMVILAFVLPPMYLNIMLNQVLVAAKRQAIWTWVMAVATVINPLLNLVFIRLAETRYHNGAIGAAISLLITEVVIVGIGMVIVGRRLFNRSSLWRFTRAAIAAVVMWGTMYATRPLGFVVSAAAGGLVFVAVLMLLRVPSVDEVNLVRAGGLRVRRSIARVVPGLKGDG